MEFWVENGGLSRSTYLICNTYEVPPPPPPPPRAGSGQNATKLNPRSIENFPDTVYVIIFAVVLFSRVRPLENFHFNLCLFIVMKTSEKLQNLRDSSVVVPNLKSSLNLTVTGCVLN